VNARPLVAALLPAGVAIGMFGCGGAGIDPVTPQAESVKVSKDRPPAGSKELGTVDVAHGSGCGLIGDRGSYEGAIALARDRTASVGGDYVELVKVTGPHFDAVCFDNRYVVHAIAFKLAVAPRPPQGAPPLAASATTAKDAVGCDPPCSPGYACNVGVCLAVCNPPCAVGQICRQDRTCGALPADAGSGDAEPADTGSDGK
jgi:hypothetical protein